jgi:hypothetical protein
LGVDEKYTTQYELLLGKIPILDDNQEYNIYYYQGLYYLSCLQNKKIVYFTKDVYPDELEEICISKLDREMISSWINTNDIDIIIDDDNLEYRYSFTREQVRAFRERV